jgi:hypothetical protein
MVEHVSLDQTNPNMNKDENIWVVVHLTRELAAQKENMSLYVRSISLPISLLKLMFWRPF